MLKNVVFTCPGRLPVEELNSQYNFLWGWDSRVGYQGYHGDGTDQTEHDPDEPIVMGAAAAAA